MIKNKQIKNDILFITLIMIFLSAGFLVATTFPNKLSFKIYNKKAIDSQNYQEKEKNFSLAKKAYPDWSLVVDINTLDKLYKEKKYPELEKKIKELKKKECNLEKTQISAFCENLFYLNGLVQYQLGLNKKDSEQKAFFNKAIENFVNTLKINPKNKWAKENIDFILKKQEEKKKEKERKNNKKNKNNKNNKEESQKQKEDEKESQNNKKQKQENSKNKKDGNKKSQNKNNKSKNDKSNKNNSKNGSDKNSQNKNGQQSQNPKSRLPKQIAQELERRQKDLENAQKNQNGFARSKSKAQKNKQQSQNPFSDPFFESFFGNDPFFQNIFNQKNLTKTIPNPDEKDW